MKHTLIHLLAALAAAATAAADTAPFTEDALRRFYESEMKSRSGRVRWHGKPGPAVISTNETGNLVSTTTYADGYVHTETGRAPTPRAPAVSTANAAPPAWLTNGVPPRLAAARLAAFRNVTTVLTNVQTRTLGSAIRALGVDDATAAAILKASEE